MRFTVSIMILTSMGLAGLVTQPLVDSGFFVTRFLASLLSLALAFFGYEVYYSQSFET
jgi:hypothetical protein